MCIHKLLDDGYTDKIKIYEEIVKSTGIPRPTVRRAASELTKDLISRVAILSVNKRVQKNAK